MIHGRKNIKLHNAEQAKAFWGFHRVIVDESGLPFGCVVWLWNFFTRFQRSIPLFSSGLEVTHNPEDEGGTFLRNPRKQLPNHTA